MSNFSPGYIHEKFCSALQLITSGEGDARKRLLETWSIVGIFNVDDFPEEIQHLWNYAHSNITKCGSTKYFSAVENTLGRIRKKKASKIIKRLAQINVYCWLLNNFKGNNINVLPSVEIEESGYIYHLYNSAHNSHLNSLKIGGLPNNLKEIDKYMYEVLVGYVDDLMQEKVIFDVRIPQEKLDYYLANGEPIFVSNFSYNLTDKTLSSCISSIESVVIKILRKLRIKKGRPTIDTYNKQNYRVYLSTPKHTIKNDIIQGDITATAFTDKVIVSIHDKLRHF